MFGIFDKMKEFSRGFYWRYPSKLRVHVLDINNQVGKSSRCRKNSMGWNGEIFNFININGSVIIPIAGLIITAVLCIELINMVMQKNNMQDGFLFFKYIIKMWMLYG